MLISKENLAIKNAIVQFETRIENMHSEVQKYCQSVENRLPEWEKLELELLQFSRRKINDLEISKQLERVQYKFQNRKRIWLRWIEEAHHSSGREKETP